MSRYTLSAEARRGLQSIIDYVEREFGSMVAECSPISKSPSIA